MKSSDAAIIQLMIYDPVYSKIADNLINQMEFQDIDDFAERSSDQELKQLISLVRKCFNNSAFI